MKSIFSLQEVYSILNFPDRRKGIEKAAQEFEAIFIQMLLSELSSDQKDPFSSPQTRFWERMYLMQVSEEIAETKGIGLKEYIIKAYEKHSGKRE